MVAIVAGAGLGLERSSAWVLGARGQLGQAGLGRGADNAYVNAANGNLVVQRADEMLIGLGPDSAAIQTFNSQTASGGSWRGNTSRQVTGLTGTVNTSGSTIKLIGWDGAEVTYTYSTTRAAYVSQEGAGSHDTLRFTSATQTWTWTDGATRLVDTFDNSNGGRITSSTDTDGKSLAFSYTAGGLLDRVTTSDGSYVSFVYSGSLLTKLETHYADPETQAPKSLTRVHYGYDGSNRLISVTVDLTPEDGSISDGKTYVTTYGYDGTSNRIASIGQSDGSLLQVTYTLIGPAYRVATLVQTAAAGVTRTTTFAYDTVTRVTTITDPLSQVTKLTYDTYGRLTKMETPAVGSPAAVLTTSYTYDTSHNVLTATNPDGSRTTYTYDTYGNWLTQVDGAGNSVARTYGAADQVLTETRTIATGATTTTRFVYDSENHLRFVIDGEGGVTEHRYTASGLRESTIDYVANPYDISGLGASVSPSETAVANWVGAIADKSQTRRTDFTYDFRGNVSTETSYGKVLASGAGDTAATTEISTTTYVYDQFGNLLKRQPSVSATAEVNLYDGLGRLISTTDFANQTTTFQFQDTNGQTIVALANGLTRTSTYNRAGELVSYAESGVGVITATTDYRYDAAGRLRIVTDATGLKTFFLYDAAGRKVAEVQADGTITEYGYNQNDRLTTTIGYRSKLTAAQLDSLDDASGNPTSVALATVRPAADPNDRYEWQVYDAADRLAQTIDGTGAATVNVYDGASRLISSTRYAQRFDATRIAAFKAAAPTIAQLPTTAPVSGAAAANDIITANMNTPVVFDPRLNDGHDGTGLRITDVGTTTNGGALAITGEATITYTPALNYKGADSFTYTVTDTQGRTSTATVSVTVYAANEFTGLTPAAHQTWSDGGTGAAYQPHLDANYNGLGVSTLVLEKYPVTQPAYVGGYTKPGSFSLGGAGAGGTFWSVTPGQRFGVSLEAKALGAATHASIAVVFYDANWNNLGQLPTSPSAVQLGDWTTLSTTITAAPANSAYAAVIIEPSTNVDARPAPMFGIALRRPLFVRLAVGQGMQALPAPAVDTAPVAQNDLISTGVGTSITFNPRRNDGDRDADRLEVIGVGPTAYGGQVSYTAGSITYTPPNGGYAGPDSFTYTISDGRGRTATATVTVNVYKPNDFTGITTSAVNASYDLGSTGAPFTVALDPNYQDEGYKALVLHKQPVTAPTFDVGTNTTKVGRFTLLGAGAGGSYFPVPTGQRVGAALEVKALGAATDVSISIVWFNASMATISTTTGVKVAAGDWTRVETINNAPSGAAYAAIVVEPTAKGDQRNAADFGVAIRRPQFVKLQPNQPMITPGPEAVVTNPLANGGFEDILTGWTTDESLVQTPGVFFHRDSNGQATRRYDPISGDLFAVMQAGSTPTRLTRTFETTGGTFSGWAAFSAQDATPNDDRGYVRIYNATTNITLFTSDVSDLGPYGSTPWTNFSTVLAAGTYTIEAVVENGIDGDNPSFLLVDDFRMTPAPAALGVYAGGPQAANDVLIAHEGVTVTINPRANDGHADGMGIRVTGVGTTPNGTPGYSTYAITYRPNAGFRGPDSFTYTIQDDAGRTSTATVQVMVYGPNEFTGYVAGSVNGAYDNGTTGAPFTTTMASNFEGQGYPAFLVQKSPVTQPVFDGTVTRPGAFSLFASGAGSTFWSVPAGQNVGVALETKALGAVTHASVSVLFMDASFNILSQSPAVNAAVGDWTRIQTTATSPAGTVYAALLVTPTAAGDQRTAPSFGLAIRKAQFVKLAAGQAMPGWQEQATNVAPTVLLDSVVTSMGVSVTIDPRMNDIDFDQEKVTTTTSLGQPANGVTKRNSDGTISYTPKAGFTGVDTFTYAATDSRGTSVTGTVTVVVQAAAPLSSEDRQTRYFYDRADRQIGMLDAEGYLTEFKYDAAGQLKETIRHAKAANPQLTATGTFSQLLADVGVNNGEDIHEWRLYDARGFLSATIDGEGALTRRHYTALGDVDQVTAGQKLNVADLLATPPLLSNLPTPAPSDVIETTSYARDAFGKILSETRAAAGGNETTVYEYDVLHRLVKETRANGSADARTSHREYDVRGRLRRELGGVGAAALAALGATPTQAQIDGVYATYGTTYVYDDADRLIRRLDPNGVDAGGLRTLYYYDTAGRLTFVINPAGEVTQYGYTSVGEVAETTTYATRIASATLAGLNGGQASALGSAISANAARDSVRSEFDAAGRLVASLDAMNALTTLSYNAFGDVVRRIDPISSGNTTQTVRTYDRRGLMLTETADAAVGGLRLRTASEYDAFGRVTETRDANGAVRRTDYDRAGRTHVTTDALGRTQEFTYDARGMVLTSTDRNGKSTTYSYKPFNREITVTTHEGVVTVTKSNAHGETVSVKNGAGWMTTWTYDRDGHLDVTMNAQGEQTNNDYDTAGRLLEFRDARYVVTRYGYDAAGRVLSVTEDFGSGRLNLATAYEYDAKGQQVKVTSPSGVVTTVDFDKNGRRMAVTVNPGGLAIQTTYDYDKRGRVLKVKEAAGTSAERITEYSYDAADRLKETIVDPNGIGVITKYEYDAVGNVVARIDPRSNVTRFVYDSENRQILAVDAMGGVQRTAYDNEGRVAMRTAYANRIALAGLPRGIGPEAVTYGLVTSAGDQKTGYAYDGDGRLRFMVDALGRPTEYVYDGAGNVIRTVEYGGPIAAAASYGYDYVRNEITRLSLGAHAENRVTRHVYDAANRERYQIDAAGQVTAFTYDANGNQTKATRYTALYAGAGDPALITMNSWTSGGGTTRVTRTLYDRADRPVFSVDGAGFVTERRYDGAGRLTDEFRYASAYAVTDTTTASDLAGMLVATGAAQTRYEYDTAGRLTDVTDATGAVTHLELDAAGNVLFSIAAEGTVDQAITKFTYDALGRRVTETRGFGTIDSSTTKYVHDQSGNVTDVITAFGSTQVSTATKEYDALNQLRVEIDPASPFFMVAREYDYDAFGNRTAVKDPRGYVGYFYYDALNRLVLQVDPEGYATKTEYGRGTEATAITRYYTRTTGASATNQPTPTTNAKDARTVFTRDKIDRLAAVVDAQGHTESYGFDGLGDRISVTNKLGGVTNYLFDGRGLMIQETLPASELLPDGSLAAPTTINKFDYDERGNLELKTEAFGRSEQRRTIYQYDLMDRLVATIAGENITVLVQGSTPQYIGTTQATPTESIKYDRRGNVIETVDAVGARTLSYYDSLDRKVMQVSAVTLETAVVGTVTTWTYDVRGDAVITQTYANTITLPVNAGGPAPAAPTGAYRETFYTYDLNHRLWYTEIRDIDIGELVGENYTTWNQHIRSFNTYDAAGNIIRTSDPRGADVFYYYDKLGRKIAQVDQSDYLTTWEHDAEGNVLKETRYATKLTVTPSETVMPTQTSHADDRITEFSYDKNGRRLTEARLGVVAWARNASVHRLDQVALTRSEIKYEYNGLGQVTKRTEATNEFFTYTYDKTGRLLKELAPKFVNYANTEQQRETTYTYDGLNNVTRTRVGNTMPDSETAHVTTYTYGPGGRLMSMTDAENFTRHYSYDANGRLRLESYIRERSDGTKVWEGTAYLYNELGALREEAKVISQASTSGPVGPTAPPATVNGSTPWVWAEGTRRNTYYNAYGEVTGRGLEGAIQEKYEYDAAGRLWRSNAGDGVLRFFLTDAVGNRTLTVTSSGTDDHAGITSVSQLMTALRPGDQLIGEAPAPGFTLEFAAYDGRGAAHAFVSPHRELATGVTTRAQRFIEYNAFGEVKKEFDENSAVTEYFYNTLGRVSRIKRPNVNYTDGGGINRTTDDVDGNGAPEYWGDRFYQDISGRQIGFTTQRSNLTVYALQAGSGYGDDDAVVVAEWLPDGTPLLEGGWEVASVRRYGVNVFGLVRTFTNELGHVEWREYDKADRLVRVDRANGMDEFYGYDGLGQRTKHWKAYDHMQIYNHDFYTTRVTSSVETTDYDVLGRVTRTFDDTGRANRYTYTWLGGTTNAGLGVIGGWAKDIVNNAEWGNSYMIHYAREETDYFGRIVRRRDMASTWYDFGYDKAGRLTSEVAVAIGAVPRKNYAYSYFNSGLLREVTDQSEGAPYVASYTYDSRGNRLTERYERGGVIYQNSTAQYDSRGRMTTIEDWIGGVRMMKVNYTYTAGGDIRRLETWSRPSNGIGTEQFKEQWYAYDTLDRATIVGGSLGGPVLDQNNQQIIIRDQVLKSVVRGSGVQMEYDAIGRRKRVITSPTDDFTYDYYIPGGINTLTTKKNGQTWRVEQIDQLGRARSMYQATASGTFDNLHRYDYQGASDQLVREQVEVMSGGSMTRIITDYYYNDGAFWHSNTLEFAVQGTDYDAPNGTFLRYGSTEHTLLWWDGPQIQQVNVTHSQNPAVNTAYTFGKNNHVTGKGPAGQVQSATYVTDLNGQVMQRVEGSAVTERFFYFNGVKVGKVEGSVADFDHGYSSLLTQITPAAGDSGSYVVREGETLMSVASSVWGDAQLWYLIADANGLSGQTAPLPAGLILSIPNGVVNVHNRYTTYDPYDHNDGLGGSALLAEEVQQTTQVAPQAKKKKKKGCGSIGKVLVAVVAVAVAAVVAPYAIAAIANATGTLATVVGGAAVGLGGTAIGGAAAFAGAAVAGAAASLASQVVGIATGVQDKISWKGVALSALSAGVTQGFGGQIDKLTNSISKAATNIAGKIGGAVVDGAVRSVVNQGIGIATGMQKKFDWAGVASGAILSGAGATGALGVLDKVANLAPPGLGRHLAGSAAGAIADAATRSLVTGTSFGDNLNATLPQAIGATVGNLVADFALAKLDRLNVPKSRGLDPYTELPEPVTVGGPVEFLAGPGMVSDPLKTLPATLDLDGSDVGNRTIVKPLGRDGRASGDPWSADGEAPSLLDNIRRILGDPNARFAEDMPGDDLRLILTAGPRGQAPLANPYTLENLNLGVNDQYADEIGFASKRTGYSPQTIAAIIDAEAAKLRGGGGRWDPNSRNGEGSSASGLTQFMDDTWRDEALRKGTYLNERAKELGYLSQDNKRILPKYDGELLKLRFNPLMSIVAAADYAVYNMNYLNNKGLVADRSPGALAKYAYIAHHEGMGGAVKYLQGSPVVNDRTFRQNVPAELRSTYLKANGNDMGRAYKSYMDKYIDGRIDIRTFMFNPVGVVVPSTRSLARGN